MSEYREWILDTIDSLRSRKARPDLERICRMVRRRHGSEPDRTCAELARLIQEQTVLKVNYKGSISYRNAAKVLRKGRKKDDITIRRTMVEDASHSDLSNGDSALGPIDQDETEDFEAEVPMSVDTDSTVEEDGAEGIQDGTSPDLGCKDTAAQGDPAHAYSAPCSPSSSRPATSSGSGGSPGWKSCRRASSLPPSSPQALRPKDCACGPACCPAETVTPGMPRDKGPSKTCVQKASAKREDGEIKEESAQTLISDQLVPDCVDTQVDAKTVPSGRPQTLALPSENCAEYKKMMDVASYVMAQDRVMNGGKNGEISLKEKMSQNLLQWSVADVVTYFCAAGFPEQAIAFRTQEIDGKSLLLMQRSDVLTGLSIRLGPALKIYERHVKVLQRTHFLDEEDL
ncbi:sterile alpha motif domain containing 1a [Hypomesus transpacificus]|uniref:sterile alpha motif domain containing 1a n=1 Tax=Hypomesus transpacificus TaxID=137520 RepID=UPI001F079A17|nr:sterile alpha motif domain containing 1a [Hypomesus transpacificus]